MSSSKILLIHSCNFPPNTGGDYVYLRIHHALSRKFEVKNLSTKSFLNRFGRSSRAVMRHVVDPAVVLYPLSVRMSYDLIFTAWSCEVPFFGDIVYAQPPTGGIAVPQKGCTFHTVHRQSPLSTTLYTAGTGITWPWRRLFGAFSLRYHTFISCSKAVRNFMKFQFNKDSTVVYPPVPTSLYNVESACKRNLVLSVGRVDPEKRFDLIGSIGTKIPEAKFVLVGGAGPTGRRIVEGIRERFRRAGLADNFAYLGRVAEPEKRELLLKAKVLLHPAPYESFSITIVEAMAAGAIPIAHNSGGTPEVVKEDNLFTTSEEAVERIKNALSIGSDAAKENRDIASRFSEERFEKELLAVVDQRLSHHSTSGDSGESRGRA